MTNEPILPRKWALRAHGQHNVFIKKGNESARHVIMKAILWSLYLPDYPTMSVEIRIGDKYKPDLVAFAETPSPYETQEKPLFWGESGVVGRAKIHSLLRRFPDTHFAFAKWDTTLKPHRALVETVRAETPHHAPFDLLRCPVDSVARFVDEDGNITLSHDDLEWVRLSD